jgi:hypothetical protein
MNQIVKALVSWPMLAVQGVLLAVISWPFADHWISYFWLIVFAAVLIGELLNKLFSPRKQTVSNNIRDLSIEKPVHFWGIIVIWFIFSVTLAVHFMVRLF